VSELVEEWFAAMRRADFAAAWQVSDRILAARAPGETCWDLPRHEQWVWDGRPLAGQRVLVRCYHGLGDTIQFARFLPRLGAFAASVTVWAQPALLELLATLPGERELLPLHDAAPGVEYDVDIEIMELGHALRVSEDCLVDELPYFHVAPAARRAAGRCVGVLATTGGWDERRSVPPELVTALGDVGGFELLNLQLDSPIEGLRDLSTPSVLELAQRIRALDLVIAPDTMVAHLAGALGVRTWTLLPYAADWRWLQVEREETPWYPTMRLFRQPAPGDWGSVLARVHSELAASTGTSRG
jgi:hypothetical protein